jgi:hypothetical protein
MTKDIEPKRNKGGRPKTRLGAPKSASFTARISQEIRDAMTEEAARTGRSIADVAEMWLEEARKGRATADEVLGGGSAARALGDMAKFARLVESELGSPAESVSARTAMLAGWREIAATALPQLLPSDDEIELAHLAKKLEERAIVFFATLIGNTRRIVGVEGLPNAEQRAPIGSQYDFQEAISFYLNESALGAAFVASRICKEMALAGGLAEMEVTNIEGETEHRPNFSALERLEESGIRDAAFVWPHIELFLPPTKSTGPLSVAFETYVETLIVMNHKLGLIQQDRNTNIAEGMYLVEAMRASRKRDEVDFLTEGEIL